MKRQRGSLSATSIDQADPARPIPAMVGRFLIEEQIGRGGMSDVYRAFDPQLNREVALKVLSPALGRNPEFTERFIRESRAAAQLNHPHVVPIFEAGSDGDTLFIAMKLIRGSDLKTHIEANGPLPLDELRTVMGQAAQALDHAHEHGLLHRDVKPANLMLERREGGIHVFLTDFGLTKSLGTDSRITHTGELVGSVHYVSPEHLEGRELDTRADVYSLGCVLYETLTGRPPFERDTDMAILWAHLNAEIPRPSKTRRSLPHVVDRVVARAMAKEPAERFLACADLVGSLDSALHGVAVDLPVVLKVQRSSIGPKLRSAMAVGAALAVFVASVVVATRDDNNDPYAASIASDSQSARRQSKDLTSTGLGEAGRPSSQSGRVGGSSGDGVSIPTTNGRPSSWDQGWGEGDRDGRVLDPGLQRLVLTRTERENYDVRSNDLGGLGEPCSTADATAGCVEFRLDPYESFLEIDIADQANGPVGASIKQDYDDDDNWDGAWIDFCNSTSGPVEVVAGARVQIWINPYGCDGDSKPTIGVITTQIFRTGR